MIPEIRKGVISDLPEVLTLIKELAEYEKAPLEVENSLAEMQKDGFGDHPIYRLYVAELDRKIVGIAIFYYKYSTWKGKCIFLEDIIVTEKMRGNKIGALLFEKVISIAKEEKVRRLEWQVLDWNEPAINFYNKYEANLDPEWINGKLVYEQLQNFKLNK